jgi:hypothetical protein
MTTHFIFINKMCDNMRKLLTKYHQLKYRLSFWNQEQLKGKNKEICNEVIDDLFEKILQIKIQIKKEKIYIQNSFIKNDVFDKLQYFSKMDTTIFYLLNKPDKEVLNYDILDTEKSMVNKMIVLREKQRQMKIGEIWQEMIGNYDGFENLKQGHLSGLDVISTKRELAIEIKNRTNTDNSSSRKTNFNKLSYFKRQNTNFTCIYASINADTEKKTLDGLSKKIIHNGFEIEYWVGVTFLKFIFRDDFEEILHFVKETIEKYSC